MDDNRMWHGCLTLLTPALVCVPIAIAANPPDDRSLAKARTSQFYVAYEINDDARPLLTVGLWYTFDEGQTWHHYGLDEDVTSPMPFSAPQEGLCGFYFVLTNAASTSGPRPSVDTEPHLWVFVDATPPVGQLHPPEIVYQPDGQTVARLRWAAIDANLCPRPINLEYRVLPDGIWTDLARRLPNSGRYNWNVPEELSGQLMFRLTVRDRGDHRVHSATPAVRIDPDGQAGIASATKRNDPESQGINRNRVPTSREIRRAQELLGKGTWHQLRGEHDLAAARLRDALELDPQLHNALVKLGASLYALGRYDESAGALELALRQAPVDREALENLAKTLVALKKYNAAEARLLAIVERHPNAADAWLHLGDVAIYQGDEVSARDYYGKAATLQPEVTTVVAKAKSRLKDLATLSRRYNEPSLP